jgi:hypothetical protein
MRRGDKKGEGEGDDKNEIEQYKFIRTGRMDDENNAENKEERNMEEKQHGKGI